MTIVACPRCRDEVSVPAGASKKALVRCPLCEEEYLLSEALAEYPPALIVIGGDMELEPALATAGAAAAEGSDYRLAGGGYGGMLDASPGTGAVVSSSQPSVRSKARPKRKEKSAVVEILKVVIGGAVGLSMGLLVLWWGFGKDPLDIGPQVSPYAPWIVPAQFRGKTTPTGNNQTAVVQNSNAANSTSTNSSTQSPPATSGDGGFQAHPNLTQGQQKAGGRVLNSGDESVSDGSGGLQTLDPLENGLNANPLAPASIEFPAEPEAQPVKPEANPGAPAAVDPTDGNPATATPAATTPSETTEPTDFRNLLPAGNDPPPATAADTEPAPATPPGVEAVELERAVGAASEALTKVDEGKTAPVEVRRQLFTDLYAALSEMGRVATQVDLASADAATGVDVMKNLASQLAAQAGPGTKMSAIGTLARGQLAERKAGDGAALAGTVTNFQAAGRVFETTVDLGSGATATVVSSTNPQDLYAIGDQVLIVGRIVEDPAANIAGYQGEATRVVLLGHAAAAPKAAPPE